MVEIDLKSLKNEVEKEVEKASNLKELNEVFNKYLGKKGEVAQVLGSLEKLPKAKRAEIGKTANEFKSFLKGKLEEKTAIFEEKSNKFAGKGEWLDVSAPGKRIPLGHLHPLTQVRRKAEEIFQSMGFTVVEGPEVENEWYNFDALNIPKDHPARDQWDTFWLKTNPKSLLRTHTSPVQARYMESHQPPLRIIVPGNVFRHEATDQRHEFQLMQLEGLMVDKEVSAANFKAIVGEFFRRFFTRDIQFKIKPDFFPFTEPSFDLGITCVGCHGKGCSLCKGSGWLEVAGAGMVHPNVFKACKLDPKEWQGWAFGFGIDRLAMTKYGIDDVRLFRSGDLRFLNQF